jgi:hypothetical protein
MRLLRKRMFPISEPMLLPTTLSVALEDLMDGFEWF